jgi:uncharacterized membrane protein
MGSQNSVRFSRRGVAIVAGVVLAALTVSTAVSSARAQATEVSGDVPSVRSPGFLFEDGRYTALQAPGARTHTYAHGINNRGRIVGGFDNPSFDGPSGRGHGTVRNPSGRFVRFDVPGAISTIAHKINDRGRIVGGYNRTGISVGAPGTKGFLRRRGNLRTINVPGSIETQALGINNHGVVVGEYVGADGIFHGFLWRKGRLRTIDGPGSLGGAVLDVNDHGQKVGAYLAADGSFRGFLLRNGRYTTFDAPYGPLDLPFDINNHGQIVGSTLSDPTGTESHGFVLRRGVGGPFKRIDFPGTTQTIARGIDDGGRIVGLYGNPAALTASARASAQQPSLPDAFPLGLANGKEAR